MWLTLLVAAVAASLEPFRIGMTVLLISRPRPVLQLLAFLAGGFAMGTTVGAIVIFVLRPTWGASDSALPRVQIAIGVLALVAAVAVAAAGLAERKRGKGSADRADRKSGLLATLARRLLMGRSLWTAGIAGLGIAMPSVDYVAVLALIVASGYAATIQIGALLLFQVVAFGLVEIPLISYLIVPDRTRAALRALNDWVRKRRRREVCALFVVVGCVLLGVGLAGL